MEDWLQEPRVANLSRLGQNKGKLFLGTPGIGKTYCAYRAVEYLLRQHGIAVLWLWDGAKGAVGCLAQSNEVFVSDYTVKL